MENGNNVTVTRAAAFLLCVLIFVLTNDAFISWFTAVPEAGLVTLFLSAVAFFVSLLVMRYGN